MVFAPVLHFYGVLPANLKKPITKETRLSLTCSVILDIKKHMARNLSLALLFLCVFNVTAWPQTVASGSFEKGLVLEKEFKVEAALAQYELTLKNDPAHVEAYIRASRMLCNIGGKLDRSHLAKKREYLQKGRKYAQQAIRLDARNVDARLAHIISLGLLSEIATNPRERVNDARLIHDEAKKMIEINPSYAEAYFVLGKWQYELSKLNWLELMACKIIFGGFPEKISIEASVNYFNKAIEFNPNSILFLYGQASAQYQMGENEKAVSTLTKAIALPPAEPDDELRKGRCYDLLREISQSN